MFVRYHHIPHARPPHDIRIRCNKLRHPRAKPTINRPKQYHLKRFRQYLNAEENRDGHCIQLRQSIRRLVLDTVWRESDANKCFALVCLYCIHTLHEYCNAQFTNFNSKQHIRAGHEHTKVR